ncbi:MAG: HIT family protein [Pseudomonadota bacterium]
MAYDSDNIFAKILRGEAPAFKVYEDEYSLAFMDVMPQVDGHTLVIPKDTAENLHDVDPQILAHTIRTTQTVAAAVKAAFEAPGIMLAQLNGSAAGQTVFHLHFHIMPRFAGVEFGMHAREMADFDLLAQHAELIKSRL